MRDLIRKGLDAYEGRAEKKDEEFSRVVTAGVDALEDQSILLRAVVILAGVNLVFWLSILIFPLAVWDALTRVNELDPKIAFTVQAAVFGIGLWLTYCIFRWRIPDLENPNVDDGVMSSYAHQEGLYRRFRIWLFSVIGGIVNLMALWLVLIVRLS